MLVRTTNIKIRELAWDQKRAAEVQSDLKNYDIAWTLDWRNATTSDLMWDLNTDSDLIQDTLDRLDEEDTKRRYGNG